MIEEVLNSIIKAEQKAEEIKNEANKTAEKILMKNADDISKLNKDTEKKIKEIKTEMISVAEKTAQEEYDSYVQAQIDVAEKEKVLLKDKCEKLAKELLGGIMNGNL